MLFYSLDDKIQQKVAGKNKKYVKTTKKKHKKQKKTPFAHKIANGAFF